MPLTFFTVTTTITVSQIRFSQTSEERNKKHLLGERCTTLETNVFLPFFHIGHGVARPVFNIFKLFMNLKLSYTSFEIC